MQELAHLGIGFQAEERRMELIDAGKLPICGAYLPEGIISIKCLQERSPGCRYCYYHEKKQRGLFSLS